MNPSPVDFSGIFPPIPTPFDDDGQIEVNRLGENLAVWNHFPLRGYVVLGSNGEAVHLTSGERLSLLAAARSAIPRDRLLIAGTGAQSTQETIDFSRDAASIGADALLVLPPSYYRARMTAAALARHYTAVADAVRVPVLIYNMPACTGVDLDVETIVSISQHPRIAGIKDSSANVVKLGTIHGLLGASFQILAGSASFLLPALSVGAVGGVAALANIAPGQCLEILTAYRDGRWKAASSLQVKMIPANNAVTSGGGVGALKRALDLLGLYGGPVRSPLMDLTSEETRDLQKTLRQAEIFPFREKG